MRTGAASTIPKRSANPATVSARPSEAATDTARSNPGEPYAPSADCRVSRNSVAEERRVDSSWRIIRRPVRATLGQWMRRRSSPSTYSRIV